MLSVRGEIDISTAPELRDRLALAVGEEASTVVVDLCEVSFLDSTALGVLVSAMRRLRATGGDLRLVLNGRGIDKIFEVTGLAELFEIFDSVPRAVKGATG